MKSALFNMFSIILKHPNTKIQTYTDKDIKYKILRIKVGSYYITFIIESNIKWDLGVYQFATHKIRTNVVSIEHNKKTPILKERLTSEELTGTEYKDLIKSANKYTNKNDINLEEVNVKLLSFAKILINDKEEYKIA